MVIFAFVILDIIERVTLSIFLSSNATILFVNDSSILISTVFNDGINKILFELVRPFILKFGLADVLWISDAFVFGSPNNGPVLVSV